MNLSPHFTLEELTISQAAARSGSRNVPTAPQVESLTHLCMNVLEPLRGRVMGPIIVSSGFRSVSVNRRIGGSAKSQHCKGEAVDFTINGRTPDEIVKLMVSMKLPYDQLISEFGKWVHVSYSPRHRRQVLRARRLGGEVVYSKI